MNRRKMKKALLAMGIVSLFAVSAAAHGGNAERAR
jgi:hypothetical protein